MKMPCDEWDAVAETNEILADLEALAALEVGLAELSRGEIVTLDELRRELADQR